MRMVKHGFYLEMIPPNGTAKLFKMKVPHPGGEEYFIIDWAHKLATCLPLSELPDPSVVVEMEQVGEYLIIIERWRGNTWVRVRIRDAQGKEVHVMEQWVKFAQG
jgi:hypothetical protein